MLRSPATPYFFLTALAWNFCQADCRASCSRFFAASRSIFFSLRARLRSRSSASSSRVMGRDALLLLLLADDGCDAERGRRSAELTTSVVLSLVKRIEYTGFSAEPVTAVIFAGYQRSSAWCRAMHSSPAWYLCVSCTGLGFASVAL